MNQLPLSNVDLTIDLQTELFPEVTRYYTELSQTLAQKVDFSVYEAALASKANLTPLAATSTSGMTDTSRLYVNTTDGYLYAHNGTSWQSTGVKYQSDGIAAGSIPQEALDATLSQRLLFTLQPVNSQTFTQKWGGGTPFKAFYDPVVGKKYLITLMVQGYMNTTSTHLNTLEQDSVLMQGSHPTADTTLFTGKIEITAAADILYIISWNTSSEVQNTVRIYDITGVDETLLDTWLLGKENISDYPQNPVLLNALHALEDLQAQHSVVQSVPRRIVCWGDSLTGSDEAGYPAQLQALLAENGYENTVIAKGCGGDNAFQIAQRMNALPLLLEPFTLPASTTEETDINFLPSPYGLFLPQEPWMETIGLGYLLLNGETQSYVKINKRENGSYFIKRYVEEGEADIQYTRPVHIVPYVNESLHENSIALLWAGTNNIAEFGFDVNDIIKAIELMIDHLPHKNYAVLGLVTDTYHPDLDEKNQALAKRFGAHFIDVKQYLMDYGLADNNLVEIAEDTANLRAGIIPRTLMREDEIHLNAYGYKAVANCVFAHLKGRGMI